MPDINTSTFISTIFPRDLLRQDETVLVSYPASFVNEMGATVNYYRQLRGTEREYANIDDQRGHNGWLYCVSSVVRPPRGEKVRRRKEDVREAYVLVLDDIGTKSEPAPNLIPSYVLETSPGNYQHGYIIEPFDVSTPEGEAHYDGCCLSLAAAGYNDPGCRGVSRVVKLPGARHKSGFVARLVTWRPGCIYTLAEIMSLAGVAPLTQRVRRPASEFSGVPIEDLQDPVLVWLGERGYLTGQYNEKWVHMLCPWAAEHTDPDAEPGSGTSYSPLDYGLPERQFCCQHGHCIRRGFKDLAGWVAHQGGPALGNTTAARNIPPALSALIGGDV